MSFINVTLPTATAPLVSQLQPQAKSGENSSAPQNNNATQIANQTAAIVSLSTDGKNRSTSTGEAKRVDGTFDKDSSRGTSSEKKADGKKSRALDVSA